MDLVRGILSAFSRAHLTEESEAGAPDRLEGIETLNQFNRLSTSSAGRAVAHQGQFAPTTFDDLS